MNGIDVRDAMVVDTPDPAWGWGWRRHKLRRVIRRETVHTRRERSAACWEGARRSIFNIRLFDNYLPSLSPGPRRGSRSTWRRIRSRGRWWNVNILDVLDILDILNMQRCRWHFVMHWARMNRRFCCGAGRTHSSARRRVYIHCIMNTTLTTAGTSGRIWDITISGNDSVKTQD